jgi:hypothetical protein
MGQQSVETSTFDPSIASQGVRPATGPSVTPSLVDEERAILNGTYVVDNTQVGGNGAGGNGMASNPAPTATPVADASQVQGNSPAAYVASTTTAGQQLDTVIGKVIATSQQHFPSPDAPRAPEDRHRMDPTAPHNAMSFSADVGATIDFSNQSSNRLSGDQLIAMKPTIIGIAERGQKVSKEIDKLVPPGTTPSGQNFDSNLKTQLALRACLDLLAYKSTHDDRSNKTKPTARINQQEAQRALDILDANTQEKYNKVVALLKNSNLPLSSKEQICHIALSAGGVAKLEQWDALITSGKVGDPQKAAALIEKSYKSLIRMKDTSGPQSNGRKSVQPSPANPSGYTQMSDTSPTSRVQTEPPINLTSPSTTVRTEPGFPPGTLSPNDPLLVYSNGGPQVVPVQSGQRGTTPVVVRTEGPSSTIVRTEQPNSWPSVPPQPELNQVSDPEVDAAFSAFARVSGVPVSPPRGVSKYNALHAYVIEASKVTDKSKGFGLNFRALKNATSFDPSRTQGVRDEMVSFVDAGSPDPRGTPERRPKHPLLVSVLLSDRQTVVNGSVVSLNSSQQTMTVTTDGRNKVSIPWNQVYGLVAYEMPKIITNTARQGAPASSEAASALELIKVNMAGGKFSTVGVATGNLTRYNVLEQFSTSSGSSVRLVKGSGDPTKVTSTDAALGIFDETAKLYSSQPTTRMAIGILDSNGMSYGFVNAARPSSSGTVLQVQVANGRGGFSQRSITRQQIASGEIKMVAMQDWVTPSTIL